LRHDGTGQAPGPVTFDHRRDLGRRFDALSRRC
jgi:hypothetical protein